MLRRAHGPRSKVELGPGVSGQRIQPLRIRVPDARESAGQIGIHRMRIRVIPERNTLDTLLRQGFREQPTTLSQIGIPGHRLSGQGREGRP